MTDFRSTNSDWRIQTPYHHIDPGFINKRLCQSAFGAQFSSLYAKHSIKSDDHMARLANHHLIVDIALTICKKGNAMTLGEALGAPKVGQIICSTERLQGNPDIYDLIKENSRIENRVLLPYDYEKEVVLNFGGEHFVASTGKLEQSQESIISIIGQIREIDENRVTIYPIIMGAPSFDHPANVKIKGEDLSWYGWEFFEVFAEDIDQFAKCKDIEPSTDEWMAYMKTLPEARVKSCFGSLLGEPVRKDWGGELADHFSASVSLRGRRTTASFLLKGPADFREMSPDQLGKRADQIYRMSTTPAELLVVQHSHLIGEAVRATLRAFAVNPSHPRHYCLIDGRDTYRILKAYDLT